MEHQPSKRICSICSHLKCFEKILQVKLKLESARNAMRFLLFLALGFQLWTVAEGKSSGGSSGRSSYALSVSFTARFKYLGAVGAGRVVVG